jgi:hypothetical protein
MSSSSILRPDLDGRVQSFRGEMESRLDRAGRDPESVGDVSDPEVEVEAERDDDPVIDAQPLEGAIEDETVIDPAERVGSLAVVAFGLDLDDGSTACPAQSIATDVDEDPLEPGLESSRVTKRSVALPGGHDGVVGRILRFDTIAEDDPGQSISSVKVLIGEGREGGSSIDHRRNALELRGRHSEPVASM